MRIFRHTAAVLLFCLSVCQPTFAAPQTVTGQAGNLLKNGSFEGGKRYWFEAEDKPLVRGDAAQGEYALRLDKGGIQSAAFELQNGKPVTISFSAKAVAATTIGWQCTPCAREIGVQRGLTWGMKAHHPVQLGTTWQRYSFSFTPDVPQDGFWPRPTYMLQFGDGDKPWLLDAVTVAYGAGAKAYIPRRPIEVQVDSPDMPGYTRQQGNIFPQRVTVRLAGSASNPGTAPRPVLLRWQLFDYEGQRPVGPAAEKRVILAPGQTLTETTSLLPLTATGLVLARFSVLDANRAAHAPVVIDSSDLPLTSLPYPKSATKPDPRERFGASFFGPHSISLGAHMGMAWSRWYPHTKWQDHQPTPDTFHWFDKELDLLARQGIAAHLVLYGWPKWIMEEGKHPLPKDMRWAANDPRWDDLTPQCAWDRYMIATARHYRGRPVVYEIENEPEFDGWDKYQDEYAKFTIRSARLLKQTDPQARVMVNNVYGIPSPLNEHMLRMGGGKWLDIISWHDYHEGWLATAADINRMRAKLDALGCGHLEIWFNEGWAYTNTAVDEPAVALTHLNAAQSTNAIIDSVAELTVNGQEKTILFHSGYEEHGMSFWDYAGPGTMLWDYYNYPLPLVAAWNTLIHHIGLSKAVGFVRPPGANFCIFDDLRNGRGVCVAYADREAKDDVTVDLPVGGLIAEDCMGNAVPLAGRKLVLSKTGRPVFLYAANKMSGEKFAAGLGPLDRKFASFMRNNGTTFGLPATWEGTRPDTSEGNPIGVSGKPVWRLDQIFPPDPTKPANYRPLTWHEGWWLAQKDTVGGQPKAEMKDGAIRMEFRAAHNTHPFEHICALSFIATKTGNYQVSGQAALKLWDGDNPVRLSLLHKTPIGATEIASVKLVRDNSVPLPALSINLKAGEELVFAPRIDGMFTGGDVTLRDLTLTLHPNVADRKQ